MIGFSYYTTKVLTKLLDNVYFLLFYVYYLFNVFSVIYKAKLLTVLLSTPVIHCIIKSILFLKRLCFILSSLESIYILNKMHKQKNKVAEMDTLPFLITKNRE